MLPFEGINTEEKKCYKIHDCTGTVSVFPGGTAKRNAPCFQPRFIRTLKEHLCPCLHEPEWPSGRVRMKFFTPGWSRCKSWILQENRKTHPPQRSNQKANRTQTVSYKYKVGFRWGTPKQSSIFKRRNLWWNCGCFNGTTLWSWTFLLLNHCCNSMK